MADNQDLNAGITANQTQQQQQVQPQPIINDTLKNNAADIGLIAGSQIAPQYFMPMLRQKYPGMVMTTGSATRLGNFSRDFEQLQQYPGMMKAIQADQQAVGDVVSGLEITGQRLAGVNVTPEMEAAARERGQAIGQAVPAFLAVAPMLGIPQEQLNAIKRAMYGEKGSVSELYNQGYGAFRPFMSANEAADQMDRLITGQFGKEYDRERMGGMSADDFGAALRFLAGSGGMNKTMFEKGSGLGLSRMREDTIRAVQAGMPIDEIWDQQAVDQAATAYYEEASTDSSRDIAAELSGYLSADENAAFSAVSNMDAEVGDLETNTGYRVDIDTTIKDKNEALKKLNEQFDKNIADAKEKGNKEAVKQLEETQKRLKKELNDFYATTNEKDENGKRLTKQEINAQREERLKRASDEGIADAVAGLQQELADIEAAKQDARMLEDPEERRAALEEIANWEDDLEARKEEDPLLKQAGRVLDTTDAADKAVAMGKIGQAIQNAYAAKGQTISTAEALEASKAMTGGTTYGKDLEKLGKEIQVTMQQMQESGRSMESLFSSSSSFDAIAKHFGIQGTMRADMINMAGEQNWKSYTSNGMTDEEAQEQMQQDKLGMIRRSRTSSGKSLLAMNGILQASSDEQFDRMMAGLDEEEQDILLKMRNHEELTKDEQKRVSRISRKALKAAGYDSNAVNEMLRDKDNIDRGADEWATRQFENYNSETRFKKMGRGLYKILGDSMKDKGNREVTQEIMADMGVEFHEAGVMAGQEGMQKRIDVLQKFADKLAAAGQDDAANRIYDAVAAGDETQINTLFTGLNKRMEFAGDRRVTKGKVEQRKDKRAEHEQAEALVDIDEQLGKAGKTGLTGVLEAIKSGKNIKDVMSLYTAATGYDTVQEEDKQLLANAMVLSGNVKTGKFINAEGIEDSITSDEINIAKQAASRMNRWQNMTEEEAVNTLSGITTKGGKELTVAEAREIAQKSFEAANARLPGGADMSAREGGFTEYVSPEERMMQDDEAAAAFEERAFNRSMRAADKLEMQGRGEEADRVRQYAMSGGPLGDVAADAEEATRHKGWESIFTINDGDGTMRTRNRTELQLVSKKWGKLSKEQKDVLREMGVGDDLDAITSMSKDLDADKGQTFTAWDGVKTGLNRKFDGESAFSKKYTAFDTQQFTQRERKSMEKDIHDVLLDIKRIIEEVAQ